jgi:hypothetical protein
MTYDFSYPPVNDEQRALNETNRQTARTIFERCVNHLLAQGRRSMAPKEGDIDHALQCAYRGDDDLMCGVGCLIDDAFYSAELEGESASSERVLRALRKSGVEANTRWYTGPYSCTVKALLTQVQTLHDETEPEDWRVRAKEIAEERGL